VIAFPQDRIHDEDSALDWWEQVFARDCEQLDAQVNAASLVRELVASLRELRRAAHDSSMSLADAAACTGYSADHIGRLVRAGRIPNVGRKNAPRVRCRDLPSKLRPLPREQDPHILDLRQIARSVVTSDDERNHDG
jgi:hypothetical protein